MKAPAALGLLALSITNIASAQFNLALHHQFDCFAGTAFHVCFGVGYNYCCQSWYNHNILYNIPFLSMEQSTSVPGDVLVLHTYLAQGQGCSGNVVGSSIYGCVNADFNSAYGGKAQNACLNRGICSRDAEYDDTCLGAHEAEGIYYKGLAYDAHPDGPRLQYLIEKIKWREVLPESEVKELEPLRLPFADESNFHSGVDMAKLYLEYRAARASNATISAEPKAPNAIIPSEPKVSKEFAA